MGLVYDACNGGPGTGSKADGWEERPQRHPEFDIDQLARSSDTIRDLFPEMEETCRVRDGRVENEFERESLFSKLAPGPLSHTARERLGAVAYTGVLAGLFIGAFTLGVRAFSVDWETPRDANLMAGQAVAAPILPPATAAPTFTITTPIATAGTQPVAGATFANERITSNPIGRVVSGPPREGAPVRLDGIVRWTGAKPIAIINGVTVEPGDVVEGYTIMAIDEQGVMLLAGGEMYYVQIKQSQPHGA